MKNKFWKVITVITLILWVATLCTWYVVKTTPPRYIKSGSFIIDTKENKNYHPKYRRWIPFGVLYNVSQDEGDNHWLYIQEITGCDRRNFTRINPELSPLTIIEGLDKNKYTVLELRDAIKIIERACHANTPDHTKNPIITEFRELEYIRTHKDEITQSIKNPNIREIFK